MSTGKDLVARLVPLEAMCDDLAAWRALASESLDPNPFYSPDFLLPCVRNLERPGSVQALTIWRGERMAGFLPLHRPNWREGMPFGTISAFWNPYTCLGVPLLAPEFAPDTLKAMLDHLDQVPKTASALYLPMLPLHRGAGRLLMKITTQTSRPQILNYFYPRATLAPREGARFKDYIALERSETRKSFRRRQARLEAIGPVEYTRFEARDAGRAAALEEFLALEMSGWKGRHGTAMASSPKTLAFMHDTFGRNSTLDFEIERLSIEGVAIAMSINLVNGAVVYTFKQAYNELYRPYGPGKLLDRHAINRVVESASPLRYDSCALPGYPIEEIWHEREIIGWPLIALGNSPDAGKLERIRKRAAFIRNVLKRLKTLHSALRGEKRRSAAS